MVVSKQTRDLAAANIIDLGEAPVKDFSRPVWLYQLGSERFPPLEDDLEHEPAPAGLVVVGRAQRGEMTSLLGDGARLVTLSGPAARGKLGSAIEAAAHRDVVSSRTASSGRPGHVRDPLTSLAPYAETLGAKEELASTYVGRAGTAAAPR